MKNTFVKKLLLLFPFTMIIPFNLSYYIEGLPLINVQRVVLLLLIVGLILSVGIKNIIKCFVKNKFVIILSLAFVILPLLSLFNTYDMQQSTKVLFGEKFLLLPFIFLIGFYNLNSEAFIRIFIRNIVISVFFVVCIAGIQYALDYDITYDFIKKYSYIPEKEYSEFNIKDDFEQRSGASRIKSTFFHSIAFGVVVVTFGSFLFAGLLDGIFKRKIVAIIGILGILFAIYESVARTPLLLLIFIYIIYSLSSRPKLLWYAVPGLIPLIMIYNYFYSLGFNIAQDSGRTVLLSESINNLNLIGYLGIGVGTFLDKVSKNPILLRWTIIDPLALNLTMIIECGIVYVPILILLMVSFSKKFIELMKKSERNRFVFRLASIIFAMFITNILFAFGSLSIFNADQVASSSFWMLVGGIFNYKNTYTNEHE